jgi:purine operon repressor
MKALLSEFEASVAGIGVVFETESDNERLVDEYLSILKITKIESKTQKVEVCPGTYQQYFKKESLS